MSKPSWILTVAAFSILSLFGGCSTLPPPEGRTASAYLTDTADTALGRGVAAAARKAGAPAGHTGIHALPAPLDAFAARVLLMRAAERSLDIQYYIWHDDITGRLLLGEALGAAERGVRVRMLLDDNGIAGLDADLAALDAHPNVEVRLFNPFVHRGFKALGYLSEFRRLNHRMHNKSLTADVQATVVGGRNVGDAYFGVDPKLAFADLDVLAAGPVARDVAKAFDEYWNSESAYPLAMIVAAAPAGATAALGQRLAAQRAAPESARYAEAVQRATFFERLIEGTLEQEWVPVRVVADPPAKAQEEAADAELLLARLARAMGRAESRIDLVSPYFVPGELGTRTLAGQAAQGVRMRIVTNSLAATDVAAVHAGYAKYRADLLRAGIRLFELKPDAKPDTKTDGMTDTRAAVAPASSGMSLTGSSTASLHGKTFSMDGQRVFVGSFNLDPRSIRLNTEMGLVIESATLAQGIADGMDVGLAKVAYEVRLTESGALVWIEQTPQGEVRYLSEPKASLGRRIGASILAVLPIEWLL